MSTHPDSTNFVRQTSPKRRPLKRTLSSANRPTSSTTTNQPGEIYRYEQVDEKGSAENVYNADRRGSNAKEANVVEETQESDDKENQPVAKRRRIDPNVVTANDPSFLNSLSPGNSPPKLTRVVPLNVERVLEGSKSTSSASEPSLPDSRSTWAAPPKHARLALPKNVKVVPSNVEQVSERSKSTSSRSVETTESYDDPFEAPPILTKFGDDGDGVQVTKTDNAQPRPSAPSRAAVHSTSAHRIKPSTVPSTSSSSAVRNAPSTSNVSPCTRRPPAISNTTSSSHVRYPLSCDSSVVRPSSSNAVRAPVPPNNILNAPSPRGVPLDNRCEVYFSNCTTQKPRLHVLSIDKTREWIFEAQSQYPNACMRFFCIYHIEPLCYIKIVPTEKKFVCYAFGTHLHNCYREPRPRCPDKVSFNRDSMILFIKAKQFGLSPCRSILTVQSGSVSYEFKQIKPRNRIYAATCGCPAIAVIAPDALWVNYTHNPDCKVLINAQVDADGRHVARAIVQDEEAPGPSRTLMIPQRSSSNAPIQRIGINLPPDERMKDWLRLYVWRHFRRHVDLNVEEYYMYWNRVQWSKNVSVKDAECWKLGLFNIDDLLTMLLIFHDEFTSSLMECYRNAFPKYCYLLGKYNGIDYTTIDDNSEHFRRGFEEFRLTPLLIQFIAVVSRFRFVKFTTDTRYVAYGDINDTSLPIAVVKKREGTRKFEVVIGNFTRS